MIEKKEDVTLLNGGASESITFEDDPVVASVSATDISVAVLSESTQLLEQHTAKIQENISQTFARLLDALKYREKQVLRQVDVLHSQQLALLQSSQPPVTELKNGSGVVIPELSLCLSGESDLIESVLSFGKVSLGAGSLIGNEGNTSPYSVPYKLEDYQDATHDHVCLYKPLAPHDESSTHQVIKFGFAPKLNLSETHRSSVKESMSDESEENIDEPKNEDELEAGNSRERRPSQVQQWLQQIIAETETEPTVGEVDKNFQDSSPTESCD